MFRDRGGPTGELSRISKDHETRLRRLESIERGIIHYQFTTLTGLRGFWPMSSVDENGDAYDLSEQGRSLSINGNPTYDYGLGIAPFLEMDGVGDYADRADEAGLDITGTEIFILPASRGLTIGGWFFNGRLATEEALIGKWDASFPEGPANQRSYLLEKLATDRIQFYISDDGIAQDIVTDDVDIEEDRWNFIVGRYDPSTELALFVNGRNIPTAGTAMASIFNSTADLNVGAHDNGAASLLQGSASHCFLCAAQLSSQVINALYQQSRSLFKV